MKRAHVSPLLLVLTAVISLSCGIGITLAAEDLAGVPMSAIDPEDFSLPDDIKDMALDEILKWLEEHPELIDDLPEDLLDAIKEKIESGDYTLEELQELLSEHPELAAVLEDKINEYLNNLKEEEEGEEPPYYASSEVMSVDDGTLDPDANQEELFTVDSSYQGEVHLRAQSYGDYVYGEGSFAQAPEFDSSIYMLSPLLYAGRSFESAGFRKETLTFHLNGLLDRGMPVGDYCATGYSTFGGANVPFSKSTESRVRRFQSEEYTAGFYPAYSPSDAALPSYLEADEANYYAFARKNYRNVPSELVYSLDRFIERNAWTSKTPPKQIEYLLQNCTYASQTFHPVGDPVQEFLESEEKVGTCTNFASAMTLLCRELGYPARLVGGYLIQAVAGSNSVKANAAHAWVEVYSSGHGWVRYDPTPAFKGAEAEQNAGSHGEVGDSAFDPESMKEANDDTLFSFSTSYEGEVYLRSASFLDYDPSTSSFGLDEIDSAESSLLFASESLESYWSNLGTPITMYMGKHRDAGMVFASYPSTYYAEGDSYSSSSSDVDMQPASDGRFFREDISTYSYLFYPEADFVYPIDDLSYRSSRLDDYTRLPSGYEELLSAFCEKNAIATLDDLKDFFLNRCELDNSQSNAPGDAIESFLNASRKGNSSVFAGAYTLIARYLGFPARFVSGYKTSSEGAYSRSNVKESDTYYWVETYEDGHGWKRVDPIAELQARPVDPIKITLIARYEGEYDGTLRSPSYEDIVLKEGELFPGDEIYDATFPAGLSPQYCCELSRLPFGNVKIRDKNGEDVTDHYQIACDYYGSYKISKKEITIATDGKEFKPSDEVTEESLMGPLLLSTLEELVEGDRYEIAYPESVLGFHNAGEEFDNNPTIRIFSASGEEVTNSCYIIHYVYGKVRIVSSES